MTSTITRQEVPLVAEQVRSQLLKLLGKRWPVGQQLPPIPQLAQELEAGQRNTLRAVQALAAEGYLISRRRLGTFVTPLVDEQREEARQPENDVLDWLDTDRSHQPATFTGQKVLLLEFSNRLESIIRQMQVGLRSYLEQKGIEVVRRTFSYLNLDLREIKEAGDAFVLFNPDSLGSLATDDDQQVCVVSTGIREPIPMSRSFDYVTIDEVQGGFLAGQKLRELGCKTPAFVGCAYADEKEFDAISKRRLEGFEQGFGERIPIERQIIKTSYVPETGARAVAQYMKLNPRPDSVFTASDELAIGFARGTLAVELETPRDYQLIGFDGLESGQRAVVGPLTTVRVPAFEMGKNAGRLIFDRMNEPDQPPHHVKLGCSMIEGRTAISQTKGKRR